MTCVNCGSESDLRFCPACGQRMGVKRLNFKEGWNDFWSRIYGFDGMLPRTLRDLTIRPGQVARSYIQGNRVSYYGPVGYFFLMVTLLVLYLGLIGADFLSVIEQTQRDLPAQNQNAKLTQFITEFVANNIKWVLFLAIPFQALAARYLFFRKTGLNYLEHAVMPLYISGHLFWLSMITFTYMKIADTGIPYALSFASPLFFGFAYLSFQTNQSKFKVFFKGIGIYFGGQILFSVALALVAMIVVLTLVLIDPEFMNTIRN